jgi:hypothetical protein
MIRLLVHIIGDIHQPLHAAQLVDSQFTDGDQGGNLFQIYYQGNLMKLHGFWDAGFFSIFFRFSYSIV